MKEVYCLKHKKWCLEFCTDCRIADLNIYEIKEFTTKRYYQTKVRRHE